MRTVGFLLSVAVIATSWTIYGVLSAPVTALAIAALLSSPPWLSFGMAVLSLSAYLCVSASGVIPLSLDPAAVFSGISLGLLLRTLGTRRVHRVWLGSDATLIFLLVLLLVLFSMAPSRLLAYGADGQPLSVFAEYQDGASGIRMGMQVPAWIPDTSVPPMVFALFLAAVSGGLLMLLVGLASRIAFLERTARQIIFLIGLGLVLLVSWGQVQGVVGTVVMPDAETWSSQLSRLTGGYVFIDPENVPTYGHLGVASKPITDIIRLMIGVGLMVMTTSRFNMGDSETQPPGSSPHFLLPLALACMVLAVALTGQTVVWLATAAALLFAFAAFVCALTMQEFEVGFALLLFASVLAGVFGWLAPLMGWLGTSGVG